MLGSFFWGLRFNDLLQCMEKHEHAQREELAKTLVEMVQKGKKAQQAENLEELFSPSSPPLPRSVLQSIASPT